MVNFTRFDAPLTKTLYQIRKGDVIETSTGTFAFDRIPKGARNWYGKSMNDGKGYRIRLMFNKDFKVIGTYAFAPVFKAPIAPMQNDLNTIGRGDLFVIKHGRGENAELFRFVRSTDTNIIAVNPVTNKTFNIRKRDFNFTKIANLPY